MKDLKPLPIFAAVLVAALMLVGLGWLIGSGARVGKCDCPCCDCFGIYWPSDCDCDDDPDIRPIPRPTPRDFPGWTPPTRGEIGIDATSRAPIRTRDPATGEMKIVGWNSWGAGT